MTLSSTRICRRFSRRRKYIRRVVVCGVMTDRCCDTTARSAFSRGYETWLVSDACGSANKTQHQAGLRGFGFAFGEVFDDERGCFRSQERELKVFAADQHYYVRSDASLGV